MAKLTKLTGDTGRKSETGIPLAMALPVVPKTDLTDKDHAVNDFNLSGKSPGGLYLAKDGTNYTIVTASGTVNTSTWITVGAATSATYVTPA